MEGLIIYKDKNGEEKKCYYSGKKIKETNAEYLESRKIEFTEIIESWEND